MFKSIIYIPLAISFAALGLIWGWMYQPGSGAINATLRLLGLGFLVRPWLSDYSTVQQALIVAATWRQAGFCMIIFLSALRGIPSELIEVASIDGAGKWRTFFQIELPLVGQAFVIVMSLTGIEALKVFDVVYVMTAGGPGNATRTLAYMMWEQAFYYLKMGYAAAVAVVLTLLVLIQLVVFRMILGKRLQY